MKLQHLKLRIFATRQSESVKTGRGAEMNRETNPEKRELNRWVPVSEKMPEPIGLNESTWHLKPLLVTCELSLLKYHYGYVKLAIYCDNGKWRWYDENCSMITKMGVIEDDVVTAWMPLPKPYKRSEMSE